MKLFVDSANLADIEAALATGAVSGVTTNPSLLAKEPKGVYLEHMERVVELAAPTEASVSIEVFSADPDEMIRQAREFYNNLSYDFLAVKIPISYRGKDYLGVIDRLYGLGIRVNCTACMTPFQAAMAAYADAAYVSLFYNRIRDGAAKREALGDALSTTFYTEDFDPDAVIATTRRLLQDSDAEIIAGSIRSVGDVREAILAGAHIVTASWKILQEFIPAALGHFQTDAAVDQFLTDFAKWTS